MANNNNRKRKSLLKPGRLLALPLAVAAAFPLVSHAESLEDRVARLEAELAKKDETSSDKSATEYSFGGYIKLDVIASTYSGGERPTATVGNDFLVPSVIPIGGDSGDTNLDFQAKHSRIWFKTKSQTAAGEISTHFEMDFGVNQIGDERISNSSASRIRHAFVSWKYDENSSLLAGQSWSTFFNVGTLPETLDFVGPVGTLFERQSQLRWTHSDASGGSWMLAVENPSTGLLGAGGAAGSSAYDNNALPDMVVRYNGKAGDLSYSVAGILREIAYKETFTPTGSATPLEGDDSVIGYGISVAGTWKLGKDDIKFQLNGGNAMGRYLGLQSYRDGVVEGDGDIELIDAFGGFIAYRHFWADQWRSSFVYSASSADNPDSVASGTTPKSYQSMHANLLYSPVAPLTLGVEYIYAEKTIEGTVNGDDSGDTDRLQFSVKYVF